MNPYTPLLRACRARAQRLALIQALQICIHARAWGDAIRTMDKAADTDVITERMATGLEAHLRECEKLAGGAAVRPTPKREIFTGPRGGRYYITATGRKAYVK